MTIIIDGNNKLRTRAAAGEFFDGARAGAPRKAKQSLSQAREGLQRKRVSDKQLKLWFKKVTAKQPKTVMKMKMKLKMKAKKAMKKKPPTPKTPKKLLHSHGYFATAGPGGPALGLSVIPRRGETGPPRRRSPQR